MAQEYNVAKRFFKFQVKELEKNFVKSSTLTRKKKKTQLKQFLKNLQIFLAEINENMSTVINYLFQVAIFNS